MSHRSRLNQLCTVFLSLALAPAVVAQPNHLPALRDWQDHQEQAAQYLRNGDYAKAEERLNLAIRDIRPYLPGTRRIMAKSYCNLARVFYHQKRYAEAEPLARWALSVRESDKQSNPDAVFQCVYVLGLIQSARKLHVEAEQLLRRSLALQEQSLGRDHINSVILRDQLAGVYIEQGKYADAEPLYLRSIAIHERKTPEENLDLADTALKYAELLRQMKRNADADQWSARARTIRDTAQTKAAKAKADQVAQQFKGFK
jgi:tetratricopeptide (TPR) repeat protein